MRYGYDDADLDDVIRILKLPALNRQAARAELRTLLSTGIAILARPRDIAPGLQNEALAKIAAAVVELQEALRDGYDAVLQRSGYAEGIYERTYEIGPRYVLHYGRFAPYGKVMYGRRVSTTRRYSEILKSGPSQILPTTYSLSAVVSIITFCRD